MLARVKRKKLRRQYLRIRLCPDNIVINMEITGAARGKRPGNGFPELHIPNDASFDFGKGPTVGAVDEVVGIPPGLAMCIDPAPLRVLGATKRDISATSEGKPVARECLDSQ